MKDTTIPYWEIKIGNRVRQDKGDIDALASLIRESKIMQPVVLDPEFNLIDGERRILAAKKLGWQSVPYIIATRIEDALGYLIAERNLNNSKPFTAAELLEIIRRIDTFEAPKAEQRKTASRFGSDGGVESTPPSKQAPCAENGKSGDDCTYGRVNEKLAEKTGTSSDTIKKIKAIGKAAEEDPDAFADLVPKMDAESVNAAHKELKERKAEKEAEADPLKSAADRYCFQINQITHRIDAIMRECDDLKQGTLGYQIHWDSVNQQLTAARKNLHGGRPSHVCPYCKGTGKKRLDTCSSCKGCGHVDRVTYKSGCKAVGVPDGDNE